MVSPLVEVVEVNKRHVRSRDDTCRRSTHAASTRGLTAGGSPCSIRLRFLLLSLRALAGAVLTTRGSRTSLGALRRRSGRACGRRLAALACPPRLSCLL